MQNYDQLAIIEIKENRRRPAMNITLERILDVAPILLVILSFVYLGKIMKRDEKTTSIEKFTVSYSPKLTRFLFYVSALPIMAGLTFLIWLGFNPYGFAVFGIMFGVSVIVVLIVLPLYFLRLEVDNDHLRYRNFMGLSKEINVNEIDKIIVTGQKSIVIYANGSKFGALNRDLYHFENFRLYCEAKGLVMDSDTGKPLTKLRLYRMKTKTFFNLGILFGAILGVVIVIVGFAYNNPVTGLASAPILFVFVFLIFEIIGALCILPHMWHIFVQESALQIKFNQEMERHDIRQTEYISPEWFIDVDQMGIIVFHRDFISMIQDVDNPEENRFQGLLPKQDTVMITGINGREIKMVGAYETIEKLKEWVGPE